MGISFIYSAKTSDGRLVALKQSRPCNLWEYYICMEVKFRLKKFNEDLVRSGDFGDFFIIFISNDF